MITAKMVNELRELYDAPMMDVKRALEATNGDPVEAGKLLMGNAVPDAAHVRIMKLEKRVAELERLVAREIGYRG